MGFINYSLIKSPTTCSSYCDECKTPAIQSDQMDWEGTPTTQRSSPPVQSDWENKVKRGPPTCLTSLANLQWRPRRTCPTWLMRDDHYSQTKAISYTHLPQGRLILDSSPQLLRPTLWWPYGASNTPPPCKKTHTTTQDTISKQNSNTKSQQDQQTPS